MKIKYFIKRVIYSMQRKLYNSFLFRTFAKKLKLLL